MRRVERLFSAREKGSSTCVKSQPVITWAEVASLMGISSTDFFAMLYRTFIDDSADQKQEIVMVAGALMGTQKQCNELGRKWSACLKRHHIRYFRSSEYNWLSGEFDKYRDEAKYPKPAGRNAARVIRDDLDVIVKQSSLLGVASVWPLPAYRKAVEKYQLHQKLDPDPFSTAMQSVMRECALVSKDLPRGKKNKENMVAFVCDDTDSAPKYAAAYAGFKAKNLLIHDILGGMIHRDDKKTPPLQAADMVASIGREMALEYIATGAKSELKRLQGAFYKLVIWDEPSIDHLASLQL